MGRGGGGGGFLYVDYTHGKIELPSQKEGFRVRRISVEWGEGVRTPCTSPAGLVLLHIKGTPPQRKGISRYSIHQNHNSTH